MSQISWIDGAIKSLVEVPHRSGTRRIYTRAQLLSYRYTPTAQQWPPSLDKRFSRSRISRNLQYFNPRRLNGSKTSYISGNNPNLGTATNIIDSLDAIRYYDDAIVSACDLVDKAVVKKGEIEKGFYDQPEMFASSRRRMKYIRYEYDEPEWYVYGPRDVEEEMDLQNSKIYTGDEEKENDLVSKRVQNFEGKLQEICETPSGDQQRGKRYDDRIKSKTNSVEGGRHRGDRPFNIKTLREIESKLKINQTETRPSGDMSAYYKLLGLVSGKTKEGEKSLNTNISESSHRLTGKNFTEHELYVDPAVSDVVEQSSRTFREDQHKSRIESTKLRSLQTRTPDCGLIDASSHTTCNPLTASYQRQVIASGPLGQNALRWFKAMTNAASANACINQSLDGVSQTDLSSSSRNITKIGSENEEMPFRPTNVKPNAFGESSVEATHPEKVTETPTAFSISNGQSHLELPLYLRPPEQTLSSAFGIGMGYNLSPRPMKPLMFYYHPQAAHLFGRPMLHPILLQQLIQRQMDIRTAALQLPFHYLRTQSMVHPLTENYYSTLFGQTLSAKLADSRKASFSHTEPTNIPATFSTMHENGSED